MLSLRSSKSVPSDSSFLGRTVVDRKNSFRRRGHLRRLLMETLETRQLLAASILGTVYEDVDRSGTRNNGENGVAGWTA